MEKSGQGQVGKRANAAIAAAIAVVALAAVAVMVALHFGAGGAAAGGSGGAAAGLRAIVHDGDGATHELPLSEDSETVITTSKGTNVVVVEGGAAFVREADCDGQDCVHQSRINAPGQQIICLPHLLWIEVVAEGGSSGHMDPDAVAGDGDPEGYDVVAR